MSELIVIGYDDQAMATQVMVRTSRAVQKTKTMTM